MYIDYKMGEFLVKVKSLIPAQNLPRYINIKIRTTNLIFLIDISNNDKIGTIRQ